jgi:uncharacterized protein
VSSPFAGETIPPRSPPPLPGPVLLTQTWRDMIFVHWALEPATVSGLFPDGTRPDTLDGRTYVGIVGFAISSTRVFGAMEIGATYELNVRLYSIDDQRRQGVVFLSMDVTRADMVLVARALPRVPYLWSRLEPVRPDPEVAGFRLHRRLRSHLDARVEVEVRAPVDPPSPLQIFLTSRWGLHTRTALGTTWIPIAHPPLPLYGGRLRHADKTLLTAVGVPVPEERAVSVLWSPGKSAEIGRPARVPCRKTGLAPGRPE